MKELSIEEKAKRYDKLKVTAQELEHDSCFDKITLFDLFPELKESEDERIRKDIIHLVQKSHEQGGYALHKCEADEMLAWLEKQGEKELVTCPICGLEIEKQGEQKPADKVEPKFKVGDWVVSPNGVYWHIDKISNNRYEVTSNTGVSSDWNLDTNIYHKFTIQDAKDGDVFVDVYENIGIYKEHDDFDWLSYFSLGCNKGFQNFKVEHENDKTHPATKEQRDLLFQKMKEEGYEWDVEKKELKKIEHRPVDKYKEWYDFIRWFVKQRTDDYTLIPSDDDIHNWGNIILNHARKVLEQKSAWSEEDEKILDGIIEASIHHCYLNITDINWLKSLRPQNRWKPSDKQLRQLELAIDYWKPNNTTVTTTLFKLWEDLKKLK